MLPSPPPLLVTGSLPDHPCAQRHLSPPAVLFPDLSTSGDPHCAPPHGPPGATASCPFGPPSLLTPPLTACAPPRLLLSDPCPFPRALQPQGSRPQQGLHTHLLIPHSLCLSPLKCSCPQDPPTTRSPRSQLPKPKAFVLHSPPHLASGTLFSPSSLSLWLLLLGYPSPILPQHFTSFPGCPSSALFPRPLFLGEPIYLQALTAACSLACPTPVVPARMWVRRSPWTLPPQCSASNHRGILGPLPPFPHPTWSQA